MAVSADIYRERSGNVTKIATNVTPPFTDSDSQEGDKYYVVPTGEQPVVLEIPPNISSFSVSNPSGQDVQITFDSDEQLGTNASDLSVQISGAESDVMARSDFTESGTGPYTYTGTYAGSSDGSYTATLQVAKDPRGNDGATGESDSVSFGTDSTPPTISNFSAANPSGQDVEVSFDSDEQLGGSSGDIDVGISGAESGSLARGDFSESGTGPYTYTATYAGSTDGDYTATLNTAQDSAGNDGASGQTSTVTVDTTAPTISSASLTDDGSGNLSFSFDSDEQLGSSNSDLAVSVDGPNTTDVYTFNRSDFSESGTGPYTYTLSATQAYSDSGGTYTATVDSAVDAAGNDGATGESDSYTLDTTAPTISNFTASNPSGQDVEVSFDADQQLGGSAGDIDVGISGAETASLARGDFSESGSGPYTYTATYTGSTDGDYTATLNAAKDPDGDDGASGQSDTVTVGQASTFQMDASTTQPADAVDLTIPHTELSSGQTVSLFADNNDTTQDFTDDTNNSEYSLSYTPSASIGSEVDLQARVDSTTDASQVVTVTVEEAPDAIADLSLTSGDQQFDATWTVPDTVEGDVTSMEIHVSTSSMTDPQPGDSTLAKTVNSGFTEGNAITETVTGQTNGQQLYVQVLTIDADGFFAGSNEATVTPASGSTTSGEPVVASYDPAAQEVTWVSGDAPENTAYDDSTQEVTWQFSPAISAFSATNPTAQDVEVSFESSTQLGSNASDLEVSIGGAETATLTRSDFTESGTGPYTYTATYSGSTSGEYTATLIIATASDGSPLSSGQSSGAAVDTLTTDYTLNDNTITETTIG